jgi:hypothetical protein
VGDNYKLSWLFSFLSDLRVLAAEFSFPLAFLQGDDMFSKLPEFSKSAFSEFFARLALIYFSHPSNLLFS